MYGYPPYQPFFDPRAMAQNNQPGVIYIPVPADKAPQTPDEFTKFLKKALRDAKKKPDDKKKDDDKKSSFSLANLVLGLTLSFPITAPLYVLFIRSLLRPLLIP